MNVSPHALKRTRLIAAGAAGVAFAIGGLVLSGWLLDNTALKTGLTFELSMKPNAALALCLTASALLCLLREKRSRWQVHFARAAGLLVMLLGGCTLSEHLIGWDLGIDELLFSEPAGEAATASPGRMGPPASTAFVLLGAGLFLFDKRTRRGRAPAEWLALTTCPIAILALLGYASDSTELYGLARYTAIALHTAVALLLLGVALFLARAESEPAAILVADNPGGEVARTMLPAAIFLPILVGWLISIGERGGLYDAEFGRALLLLSLILLFTVIVWRVAWRLSAVASERAAAEQASADAREEARRLAAENLETLSVLESLLAHAPIGLVFFDRTGRCVRINPFLAQTLKAAPTSATGRLVNEILPGFSMGLESAIESAFARGVSTMDIEITSAPGTEEERSWIASVFPVRDGQGSLELSGAILMDITDRKRLEAQKAVLLDSERAARIEAERAATLKDQFLATLSHELRTPLNAILGWTRIAQKVPSLPPDLERPLDTIERNARVQAQLIEDLLDISRIVSGNLRVVRDKVELRSVVHAALTSIVPLAKTKEVDFEVNLDPGTLPVTGDAARLQQVVWNLASNAVKFTHKQGRVELSVRRRDSWLDLRVQDDGVGIPAEFLPHVFERFRQADPSSTRHHGGLGLGLSIVKQLVELHGGSVQVESAGENKGATFVVSLPLAVADENKETSSTTPRVLLESSLSGVRVLIVDDESDAREFLGRVLSDAKAIVSLVSSVDEALLALARDGAQVLVSDIGMPGKDGYELIRTVRQSYDAQAVPAIAVTAFARVEDRARALSAGFQLHVAKPIDSHELTLAVASLASARLDH